MARLLMPPLMGDVDDAVGARYGQGHSLEGLNAAMDGSPSRNCPAYLFGVASIIKGR
jgi:hypothetical protein